jgi:metacaspase-1
MSWAFVTALDENPHMTYTELLKRMRTLLSRKYSQVPQMSTAHPMDLLVPVDM